ncbi:MAG: hypothetical protein UY62_C0030G0005 [Parcubacteria group bacterium GW2011_GWF2_50_9]|nr:MAG: hypothetical protein UY62_C0030G0005 [Parcubacteria group bacterium GW2011_GWF2_50_9]
MKNKKGRTVQSHINTLFAAIEGIIKPEVTREEKVLIAGVGSGGGRVAEELVRIGIQEIVLLDKPGEKLEVRNIFRHTLGHSDIGRLKTVAMRDRLKDINPGCKVTCANIDVVSTPDKLPPLLQGVSQVYICVDNEEARHVINQAGVEAGIHEMILGAVFDGGCGGEVGRIKPEGACYACMTAFLERTVPPPTFGEEKPIDYSNPNKGTPKSTPALNMDIAQIAILMARIGLQSILGRTNPEDDFRGNYLLFGNRVVKDLFPYPLFSKTYIIPKTEGCLICGSVKDNFPGR